MKQTKQIARTKRQRKMIYFSILGKSIMIMWRKYYLVSRQQMITAHLYTKDKYLQTIKELSIAIICKECGIDLRDYNDKNVKCKPKPSSIIKDGTIIPSHHFAKKEAEQESNCAVGNCDNLVVNNDRCGEHNNEYLEWLNNPKKDEVLIQ